MRIASRAGGLDKNVLASSLISPIIVQTRARTPKLIVRQQTCTEKCRLFAKLVRGCRRHYRELVAAGPWLHFGPNVIRSLFGSLQDTIYAVSIVPKPWNRQSMRPPNDLPAPRANDADLRDEPVDIEHLETVTRWMDDRFRVPGTGIRFGLDAVLGLIPGLGDAVAMTASGSIIYEARRLGVPTATLLRMVFNVVVDIVIGTVPLIGDLFDVGFKANRRNLNLLKQHLGLKVDDGGGPGEHRRR